MVKTKGSLLGSGNPDDQREKTQWEKNCLWYEHIEVDDVYCSLRFVSEDVAIVIVDATVFVIRHCKCMGGSTKQCLMHYVQWWDILNALGICI